MGDGKQLNMRHLNYNHLQYFWTVAREGSIARAADVLHLTPQTISGQLKLLEQAVGEPLFERVGRGLVLTDTGHTVLRYADEIFALGTELSQVLRTGRQGAPSTFRVGIVNSIAKLITYQILSPVLSLDDGVRISCVESDLEALLGDLAVHRLDFVLSDRPIPHGLSVKAYNHALGESRIAFFAPKQEAKRYARSFPASLDNAPMLMPLSSNAVRRSIDDWLEQQGVSPRIVAEFDDSALMKAFAEAGTGVFPAPVAVADEICDKYRVREIGTVDEIRESYYAISPERRVRHPAVLTITERARGKLIT